MKITATIRLAGQVAALMLFATAASGAVEPLGSPRDGNGGAPVPESRAALGAPIDVDCPACAAVKPNPASEGPTRSKTPAPRTISEAIHAYCHCLYLRSLGIDVSAQKGTKDQEEEKKDSGAKGEIAPGSRGKTGKTGKTDKDEKEEAKNDKSDNGDNGNGNEEKEAGPAWYSAHAQATVVTQIHQHFFPSPYVGANSLLPSEPAATSITSTLFLATRLWQCGNSTGDLIFDPEIAGGRGFSSVLGLAGFPNGEISRVGLVQPTPYIARLFLRQTWGLGGEQEKVEDAFNQIAGMRDIDRITLVVGKIPATDLVDDNRYSHDPRTQFLNWSLMYNGAWDYPANVRGYDYGAGLEVNRKTWALRYGAFGEPEVANGAAIDPKLFTALGHVIELEERYTWDEHPGHLRLLAFLNHAHMGNYREALAMMPVNPDITLTRAYRIKYGFGLSWDQEITKDLGVFSRLGWNDGHSETWAFTEIDETACLGLVLKGRSWCRPDDTVGLGVVCNGLSSAHRDYLAAGGLGFIIGDGRLNYGLEKILEVYYSVQINKSIFLTFDFQEVDHPAYNRDRGPVAIGTIRVHFEF